MNKLSGFVKLLRPINCVMMGFAVFVGAFLVSSQFLLSSWLSLVFGFFTGFLLCGAAMTINDYYDRQIDAVNEPTRPIPSGLIKVNEALAFVAVLTVAGLVLAFFTSIWCLLIAAAAWVITVSYVTAGKRTGLLGNFLVSTCVAIPFIYGSVAVSGALHLNVILFALMAFLSNTGREITKGIVDTKGDRAEGIKTMAVRFDEKKAAVAAVLFYVSAVALTPVTWFLGLVHFWFIPFVLVTDVGLVVCSVLLMQNYSRERARKIKNIVLLLFLFGLLAFIFGRFP